MTKPSKSDPAIGQNELVGMTLNERLLAAGLLDPFESAARARERRRMIEILRAVHVQRPEWSADTILANPEHYGF